MRRLVAALLASFTLAAGLALGGALPASADVDDFTFESFDADYTLARDDAGRSTLKTVETLVALFPETDQNHGIRRQLVDTYDGHPTDLHVQSVTDESGAARSFEEDEDDGLVSLTIADDDFVHGRQTYVITYTQKNVTRFFEDTDADEFYWDTNGTDWRQPFGRVTARVHLAGDLGAALNGNATGVYGAAGATNPATVTQTADGYEFSASDLQPFENLTLAIGFRPGTFTPRDDSFFAEPWPLLAALSALVALVAAAAALGIRLTRLRDAPGRGIIVPEYVPPKDAGILLAALIAKKTGKAVPAQLLALAVAGRARVVETPASGIFGRPRYELEFLGTQATSREAFRNPEPTADETEFLHALFGETLTPGERRSLAKADTKATQRLSKLQSRIRVDAVTNGYRRKPPTGLIVLVVIAALLGTLAAFVFGAVSASRAVGGPWPFIAIAVAVLGGILAVAFISKSALDARGVQLRDYLRGLDEYIRLAEADRIRYLQSPQGVERTPVAVDDPRQLLRLNEQLLPWAVLLGHEKEWTAELGRYYEQTGEQPGWYVGPGPFTGVGFASSIGSMSSSMTSTYSSSSGGSSGGASSGGGGGGGGGGGV
ncbi:DUF2207 domain-containing protein [Rathayibacter sp. YIM 133350]|uniref:DUF2207 domain-containing protein n=1 Tax=Rathayibacter sp. YIM 133350 TaxID=3131992 RepID=UPI00307FC32E